MSARIDPQHGTEQRASTGGKISMTGGSAPMAHPGAPAPTLSPADVLAARSWRTQPKGTRAMPASFRPAMVELARRLHSGEMPAGESYWWDGPGVMWRDRLWASADELNTALGIGTPKVAKPPKVAADTPKPQPVAPPRHPEPARTPGVFPEPIADFLARLVYETKREYATAYAAHRCHGTPRPADPGTDWAMKARVKVDRLVTA